MSSVKGIFEVFELSRSNSAPAHCSSDGHPVPGPLTGTIRRSRSGRVKALARTRSTVSDFDFKNYKGRVENVNSNQKEEKTTERRIVKTFSEICEKESPVSAGEC